MASAQVVEMSVTNNSLSQDSNHPDNLFQSRYATPGFKPFSYLLDMLQRLPIVLKGGKGQRYFPPKKPKPFEALIEKLNMDPCFSIAPCFQLFCCS